MIFCLSHEEEVYWLHCVLINVYFRLSFFGKYLYMFVFMLRTVEDKTFIAEDITTFREEDYI